MHPAFSVIFLTTLIGVGQGLFLALMTAQTYSLIKIVPVNDSANFYGIGAFVALMLLVLGLIASFFHLGHPERAWRAASQWRTSWMSREVIILPITMFLIFVYTIIHYFDFDFVLFSLTEKLPIQLSFIIGVFSVIAIFLLFLCTSMIYIAIKFIQEWATPLTFINYTLLGLASGFSLAAAFATIQAPNLVHLFVGWAIVFTLASLITRIFSLIRNSKLKPISTVKTAIGIRHNIIKQIAQGAMGGSFNTREFFHGKTDFVVFLVKWVFMVLVFLIPTILLIINFSSGNSSVLIFAVIVQYVGLLAERWFFFAQANHPQNIYYQAT
jgi:DMSO reductase anchor subunit